MEEVPDIASLRVLQCTTNVQFVQEDCRNANKVGISLEGGRRQA